MASITDDNILVMNQGKNPLVNFNFMLRVELLYDLPCKSVRAFQRELEYEYIQEGGLNDYVHMRRKPISKPFTLEIERYVGVDYVDPLPLGADLILPVMLFVSRNHGQFIPGVTARTYVFTGCTVMKKTYGDLVGEQSGLLVETTTLGYREMLCVDIPWSEVGDDLGGSSRTNPSGGETPPTNSRDAEKEDTDTDYKIKGQDAYNQAFAAKHKAQAQYDQGLVDEMIGKLEDNLKELRTALDGGVLDKKLSEAQSAMKDSGGKTKEETADASRKAEADCRQAVEKAKKELSDKKKQWQDLAKENEADPSNQDAQKQVEELKAAVTKAEEALQKAEEELQKASEKVAKDRVAAEEAAEGLRQAQKQWDQGMKRKDRLQNSLTNLKSWKEKAEAAKKACDEASAECNTQNEKLQGMPDEPKADLSTQFEQVKKYADEALQQERRGQPSI